MSLCLHCETRIVISRGCVLDVGVRVYVCVAVYTLVRHLFSGFLTVAKSSKDIGGPFCGFQYVLMFAL